MGEIVSVQSVLHISSPPFAWIPDPSYGAQPTINHLLNHTTKEKSEGKKL